MHSHDINHPTAATAATAAPTDRPTHPGVVARTRTRRTGVPRRLLSGTGAALAALALVLTLASPAQASGYYGKTWRETGCTDGKVIRPRAGEIDQYNSLIIRDKTGVDAGRVTFYHSNQCLTSWATWWTWDTRFHGEVSIWNSAGQNQKAWSGVGQEWSETRMVDDNNGLTTCVGMQVYYQNQWRRWDSGWCW